MLKSAKSGNLVKNFTRPRFGHICQKWPDAISIGAEAGILYVPSCGSTFYRSDGIPVIQPAGSVP